MAEGGEITPYCSKPQTHHMGCEFYADGGEIPAQDETSRWLLGQEDKHHAVSSALFHSGAHQLLIGNLHGTYADHKKGLRRHASDQLSKKIEKHLSKPQQISHEDFAKKVLGQKAGKLGSVMLLKMLAHGDTEGFHNLHSYTKAVTKGSQHIDDAVQALFNGGECEHLSTDHVDKQLQDKLHEFVEKGHLHDQVMTPEYAEGGDVEHIHTGVHPMAKHLPEHNMMIHEAKSRVNQYLNSVRPVKQENLMFDHQPTDQTKQRSYENALNLANHPKQILRQMKTGRLTPEEVSHFKNLYPELYQHLSQKMTEHVITAKLEDKKPSYSVRQSLSLFLGAPLDSTFSPESIQAAQAVFAAKQPPPQQPGKGKGSKAKLDQVGKSYLTPDQSALSRQQRAR